MGVDELIRKLRESGLFAECPFCSGEFNLSQSLIFDGTKPFPAVAAEVQRLMADGLKKREDLLKKRMERATKGAEATTKAINIGNNLEKVLPSMKDFKWDLPDSKFLGNPIDLIIFNGLCRNKVESISFVEVKSGGARLNAHQKSIRDAILDKKVKYEEFV